MQDVNGIKLEIGQRVYDLSIAEDAADQPVFTIETIEENKIVLNNGKLIRWKGKGYFVAMIVK